MLTQAGMSEETVAAILGVDLTDVQSLMVDAAPAIATGPLDAYTFAPRGEIKVPAGDLDFIPGFFNPAAGRLVRVAHKINSGTSVTYKLQKNGVDIPGFTGLTVETVAEIIAPGDVALAVNDMIAVVVTAVSGTPQNLSVTIVIAND